MAFIRFTATPPFRGLMGRAQRADKALLNAKRNQMRVLGREAKRVFRDEAPKGKTGKFRQSIGYRTSQRGNNVIMTLHMSEPLGTFITEGTKPHFIRAKNKKALFFMWPKFGGPVVVPKAGGFKTHVRGDTLWVGKGGVDHPGTEANPFHKRAYRRFKPKAKKALNKISLRWQAEFTR